MPWWLALLNSSLGIISAGFGVVALIRPQTPLTLLVLVAAAVAQLGDAAIGVVHRVPGMVAFPLVVALLHLITAACVL